MWDWPDLSKKTSARIELANSKEDPKISKLWPSNQELPMATTDCSQLPWIRDRIFHPFSLSETHFAEQRASTQYSFTPYVWAQCHERQKFDSSSALFWETLLKMTTMLQLYWQRSLHLAWDWSCLLSFPGKQLKQWRKITVFPHLIIFQTHGYLCTLWQ